MQLLLQKLLLLGAAQCNNLVLLVLHQRPNKKFVILFNEQRNQSGQEWW
jgi:hypothetical protein